MQILILASVSALFFFLGILFEKNIVERDVAFLNEEDRYSEKDLPFVNPLLECENFEARELASFKSDVEGLIEKYQEKNYINESSVYFRDLNDGLWFGINERELFAPASLLKLPFAITLLKNAEKDLAILNEEIYIDDSFGSSSIQNIKPEKIVQVGESPTVKSLLESMMEYSDNVAQDALGKRFGFGENVFLDLGIELPDESEGNATDFMMIKDYARFFRVLYNGSYLSEENSNYLLSLLAKSKFKDGLVRELPPQVTVAHKFGERMSGVQRQLHDCGIIYLEPNPYILCVMSRGEDFAKLSEYIGAVSKLVYDKVSSQN